MIEIEQYEQVKSKHEGFTMYEASTMKQILNF
jgi:hypothetical protein